MVENESLNTLTAAETEYSALKLYVHRISYLRYFGKRQHYFPPCSSSHLFNLPHTKRLVVNNQNRMVTKPKRKLLMLGSLVEATW